ncbi:MAG: hypothetical protein KKE37_06300, partial [Verrucomicrobia bacterium]|nr:hypothetical protein [Verrucomicrobiota bacterium]
SPPQGGGERGCCPSVERIVLRLAAENNAFDRSPPQTAAPPRARAGRVCVAHTRPPLRRGAGQQPRSTREENMKDYITVNDISEQQFEELVRRRSDKIEKELVYMDHQKSTTGGRLDVLMVDSGKSLVVVELKVKQDDGMLFQGLDYYDYVSTRAEAFARLYKHHSVDATKQPRLFLIAPSFSQTLVNRCKWLSIRPSLFTYVCLKIEGEEEIIPAFSEQEIPSAPDVIEITHLSDHMNYITDAAVRTRVEALLEEIKNWKPGSISLDAISFAISMKINNRVFAYLYPRRQYYQIGTYNADDEWTQYPIKSEDDLEKVKPIAKAAMDSRMK